MGCVSIVYAFADHIVVLMLEHSDTKTQRHRVWKSCINFSSLCPRAAVSLCTNIFIKLFGDILKNFEISAFLPVLSAYFSKKIPHFKENIMRFNSLLLTIVGKYVVYTTNRY